MMLMVEKSMIVLAIEPVGLAVFAVGAVAGALIARALTRRRASPEVDAKPGARRPAAPTPAPPRRQP